MAGIKASIELNKKDLKDLNDIQSNLSALGAKTDVIIDNEAERTVRKMKKDVRKDTRRLKNSIKWESTGKNKGYFEATAIDPESGVDYASIQEQASVAGISTTPYFFHNIRAFKRNLTNELRRLLVNLIEIKGNRYR